MSVLNVVLPLGSSVLSFVFAALVFDQWWQRRQSFQLVWAIGLLWYGISAGTEFLGGAVGWTEGLYRAWYLIGAFFVAAYLGAGTIYLLAKTRFGYFAGVTVLIGGALSLLFSHIDAKGTTTPLYLAYMTINAPLPAPGWAVDPATHVPVGSGFPGYLRVLTGPFNIAGALCLVFGAIYSAYVYMPKQRVLPARLGVLAIVPNFFASLPGAIRALFRGELNSRVPATLLIALGAFIPGVTSGLNRFGVTWSFFLGEFLGVVRSDALKARGSRSN